MAQIPSYVLKVDRAEQHLIDLEIEIRRYVQVHPYAVRKGMEGKRQVYSLEFSRQPDDYLSVIVGDFVYNIDSALNHLAASLVPSKKRSSVSFPIFWQGVWNDPTPGEDAERGKHRQQWLSYTRDMPDEAVAILKANQPPDTGRNVDNTHALAILRRLRNTDAHKKLTVVSSMLVSPIIWCTDSGGVTRPMLDPKAGTRDGFSDGAEIEGVPKDAVDVKIEGTPKVTIRVGKLQGGISIPDSLRDLLLGGTRGLIDALRPYDRFN